jgi:hypothetical protein
MEQHHLEKAKSFVFGENYDLMYRQDASYVPKE